MNSGKGGKEILITAKNNHPDEQETAAIVKDLYKEYPIPTFTHKIQIEKGVAPHSHPILTLNTRTKSPLAILKTLIHEQMHWFVHEHPSYDDCIKYLKRHYKDNGECNNTGIYPNSFWTHIAVCFNTRLVLQNLLKEGEIDAVYKKWQAYPETEKLVVDKWDQLKKDLFQFDMMVTTLLHYS